MAAHPHLVRRIRDEGHQTGSHAYGDADVVGLSAPRAGLELALTQNVLGDALLGNRLRRQRMRRTGTATRTLEAPARRPA